MKWLVGVDNVSRSFVHLGKKTRLSLVAWFLNDPTSHDGSGGGENKIIIWKRNFGKLNLGRNSKILFNYVSYTIQIFLLCLQLISSCSGFSKNIKSAVLPSVQDPHRVTGERMTLYMLGLSFRTCPNQDWCSCLASLCWGSFHCTRKKFQELKRHRETRQRISPVTLHSKCTVQVICSYCHTVYGPLAESKLPPDLSPCLSDGRRWEVPDACRSVCAAEVSPHLCCRGLPAPVLRISPHTSRTWWRGENAGYFCNHSGGFKKLWLYDEIKRVLPMTQSH